MSNGAASGKAITVKQAIDLLTDEAQRLGAHPDDTDGIIRRLIEANGLGFEAWFCVCCELGTRRRAERGIKC